MNQIHRSIILALSIALLNAQFAFAEAYEWKFDKPHCNFFFETRHIYATVRGFFSDYSGTFIFDPANPETGKMKFELKVKSVQTAEEKRDTHLLSADFFDVDKFPIITFESSGIKKRGENQLDVTGKLTIKDVSKQVTLPLTFLGEKDHALVKNTRVAGFEGRLPLDRLEYHVGDGKYYKMGVVGKDVDILVSLEMLRDK